MQTVERERYILIHVWDTITGTWANVDEAQTMDAAREQIAAGQYAGTEPRRYKIERVHTEIIEH